MRGRERCGIVELNGSQNGSSSSSRLWRPLRHFNDSLVTLQNAVPDDKEELLEMNMHLQNILAIMGIVLFISSIVRGCGGMMGGCGMGSRSTNHQRLHDHREDADAKQSPEPVGNRR